MAEAGHIRASHADREHAVGVLKTAFVRGMLDKDEFDERVSHALASRTYAELAVVTADLPADLPAAGPPPARPAQGPGWLTMKRAVVISALLIASTALPFVIGLALGNQFLILASPLAFFVATVISGPLLAEAWSRRHSQPRLPRGPASGPGRRAVQGPKAKRSRRSPGPGRLTLAVPA